MYQWRSTLPQKVRPKKQPAVKVLGIKQCLHCKKDFEVLKNRKTLCSKRCMYDWRKTQNWETVKCVGCGIEFSRRKNEIHHSTGLPKQYCSNSCSRSSIQKKEKLRKWANTNKNHWNNPEVQAKVKQTKLERYGDENYNNIRQQIKTSFEKYNTYTMWLGKSNGKRISKPQRILYEQIKQNHTDAILEEWLSDAQKSVDIYIPSQKKIIELYGTYWHCDPRKYEPSYYNKAVHMTAQQIWERDEKRSMFLKSLGYDVEVIWENDVK
jgi:hypothetical protein